MPTYDYRCQACHHTFERFHSPDEKIGRTCPKCKRRKVERLIGTGAGIIFKGSGFYETDYKRSSYKADKEKETGSTEKDAKKESKKGSESSSADKPKESSDKKGDSPKPD